MKLAPLIYKRLAPFFKKHGFIKKGSMYYKIENDIAFCVTFEFPSSVRVWCHILPLYMPTEFVHLSHGNIIDNFYRNVRDKLSIYEDVSDREIDIWAQNMTAIFESDVFSFFDEISTPQKLFIHCDLSANKRNKFLPHTRGVHMLRLQAYTALYIGKSKTAKIAIESFEKSVLQNDLITPNLVDKFVSEADEMRKMLCLTPEERDARFKEICEKTHQTCFVPRRCK